MNRSKKILGLFEQEQSRSTFFKDYCFKCKKKTQHMSKGGKVSCVRCGHEVGSKKKEQEEEE